MGFVDIIKQDNGKRKSRDVGF